MHRDGLAHKFQFVCEVIELMAHPDKTLFNTGVNIAVIHCIEEVI